MPDDRDETLENRVLVLAPTARDAAISEEVLSAAGIPRQSCGSIEELCREATRGAGAAIVSAEAVIGDRQGCLAQLLRAQPPWSDLPLIVLTVPGPDSARLLQALEAVGHTTLMKRPVQVSTLISSV